MEDESKPKASIKKPMTIMLIGLGILFGGIVTYKQIGKYYMGKAFANAKNPVVTVSSAVAKYEIWKPRVESVGSSRAVTGVNVTAQLGGMIQAIHFTPGKIVKSGEVLVQQNADPNIGQLEALQASEKLAKITYMRDKKQYKVKGISKQQLDTDLQNWKNYRGLVAQQQAIVKQLTITAPFEGKLGISKVNPGQYLSPGDAVVTLQSLDPIYVDFTIPQNQVSELKLGQEVKVTVDAFPGKSFTGKLTTIDPIVDSNTRNITAEATVPNADHRLLPGMFTNVSITREVENKYIILPKVAISFNPYGDIVYTLKKTGDEKKGKEVYVVKQKFVSVGETRGDQIAVLTGVTDGEMIVTSGQLKLRNGSHVVLNNAIEPSDSINPKVTNQHNG